MFDRLRRGSRWRLDPIGYNFRHDMEFAAAESAALDGPFEVRYAFRATTGAVTNVWFQVGTAE
jgi:hypothetical protein